MRKKCLLLVMLMSMLAPVAASVEVSIKNNIGGHFEYAGFTIVPVSDVLPPAYSSDLSPAKMFEIVRPNMQAISIGRLYTSCTCIQAEIEKKTFGYGERALVTLRNVQPTKGQDYPFYIQVNFPLRVVLRHDTFVISDQFVTVDAEVTPADATPQPDPTDGSASELSAESIAESSSDDASVEEAGVSPAPAAPAETPISVETVFEDTPAAVPAPVGTHQEAEIFMSDEDLQ